MDPVRKSKLTLLLLNKKNELLNTSKREMSNLINGNSRQSHGSGNEDGDLSISLQMEDVSISALKVRSDLVKQIDNALLRLREDEYGTCEECGEEIDERRLQVMPFALLCKDCQEDKELMEKQNRTARHFLSDH